MLAVQMKVGLAVGQSRHVVILAQHEPHLKVNMARVQIRLKEDEKAHMRRNVFSSMVHLQDQNHRKLR